MWSPEQYSRGKYFQTQLNETFRKNFGIEPHGAVLDIGCGDGEYSSALANRMKHGYILGVDSSAEMISHANQHWGRENLFFEVHRIEEFQSLIAFDFILSFWCLQWTNIEVSFPAIFHSLKNGGRVYAVFSSFTDNSVIQVWRDLAKQAHFKEITEPYLSADNQQGNIFFRVINSLNQLPFKQVKLNLITCRVAFPTIDYFKNLLLTMPCMKKFPPEILSEVINLMSLTFQTICQRRYGDKLYYETRPIFLEAIK